MGLADKLDAYERQQSEKHAVATEEVARQASVRETAASELQAKQEAENERYKSSVLPGLSNLLIAAGAKETLEEYKQRVWGGLGEVDTEPVFSRDQQTTDFQSPRLTLSLRYPYDTVYEDRESVWLGDIADGSWHSESLGWRLAGDQAKIAVSVNLDQKLLIQAQHSLYYDNNYVDHRVRNSYGYNSITRIEVLDPTDPRKSLENILVEIALKAIHPLTLKARADAFIAAHPPIIKPPPISTPRARMPWYRRILG